MKKIIVSAPGKIHLLGEHSVVYGKPAILASINKRCFVTLTLRKDDLVNLSFEDLETSPALDYLTFIVDETLKYFNQKLPFGFNLSVNLEIPLGCGLGSSAALAVSVIGAVSLLFNKHLDKEIINEIAFKCEQRVHGNPSGGDNTACCYGGFIWYKKEGKDAKVIKPLTFNLSQSLLDKFTIIYTGKPNETTGEMVKMVNELLKKKPKYTEKIFDNQEKLVHKLLTAIKTENTNSILDCIRNGEQNLEKLGVVSEYVKSIIREIEKIGGAAKICGGGGATKGTGVLLVFNEKPALITQICSRFNLSYSIINLGVEGVRREICKK